jgi:hypothetical protein
VQHHVEVVCCITLPVYELPVGACTAQHGLSQLLDVGWLQVAQQVRTRKEATQQLNLAADGKAGSGTWQFVLGLCTACEYAGKLLV